MIETHDLFTDTEGGGIQSWCSCGLSSRQAFTTEQAAIDAWDGHCDEVFFKASEQFA